MVDMFLFFAIRTNVRLMYVYAGNVIDTSINFVQTLNMEWSNLLWQPQWNKRLCSWALQFTSLLRLHSQRKYVQQQKRRYLVFFFSQKTRELCQVQKGKYWVTKTNLKSIHCLTGKQICYEIIISFILEIWCHHNCLICLKNKIVIITKMT